MNQTDLFATALPAFLAQAPPANGANGGFWAFGGCVFFVIILLALVALGLIIWAVVDLVGNPGLSLPVKVVWAVVIFFIPLLGSILYLVIGRNMTTGGPPGGTSTGTTAGTPGGTAGGTPGGTTGRPPAGSL